MNNKNSHGIVAKWIIRGLDEEYNRNCRNFRDRYLIIRHDNTSLADILCGTARYEAKAIDRHTGREIERAEGHTSYEAEMDLKHKLNRIIFLDSLRSHF